MKTTWLSGCCFFLASALCYGADVGVVTVLDGNVRVLRAVSWYKLVEGARVQDSDVIDVADRAQVQVELVAGPIVNIAGPAEALVVGAGTREGKQPGPAEIYLTHGWVKLAAKAPGVALRVRSPAGTIVASDAIAVMHAEAGAAPQKFVAAMPRHFRDPLPARAAQYQVARVQLVADRPINYVEAEPWLASPYR